MLVLPADQTIEREDVFRDVLRAAADHLATGAFGIDDPLVTLGVAGRSPGHRVRLPPAGRGPGRGDRRSARLPAPRVRGEAEPGARRAAPARARRRLERRDVPVAAAGDPRRARAVHRAGPDASGRWPRPPAMLERAYESIQKAMSIDYAVMEGAARDGQRRDGVDGRRLVGPRLVDRAARRARIARRRARSSRPARPSRSDADDLIVRRMGGRLGVIAPLERGSMTATQPIAVLRGAAPDQRAHRSSSSSAAPNREADVTTTTGAPAPDDHRLRDRRLARADRRRVHLRERPPLRRRRRALRRRARRAGQGRRHRLRPAVRVGALRGRRRRGARSRTTSRSSSPRTPSRPR